MSLADKVCLPCQGNVPSLTPQQWKPLLAQLKDWQVNPNHHLVKSIKTKDFATALELTNKISAIAEEQQHHPDILLRWGELNIELWTHAIAGLTEADFILAAKIDRLL